MQSTQFKVLMVEDNIGDARLIEEFLADAKNQTFRVQGARSLASAVDMLDRSDFDAALVDLSLPDSHGLETFLAIQRRAPRLPIVVITGLDDHDLAVRVVAQGAQDYLTKNKLTTEVLVRALNYGIARSQTVSEEKPADTAKATVIGFLGVKGGVGTTTIACYCALELNRRTKQKILLMETQLSSASAAFLLKAQFPYTFLDAAKSLHRLDTDLWRSMTGTVREGLDLLQSPGAVGVSPQSTRVRQLLQFARPLYGCIVVDLGRLNETSQDLLEEMTGLFVIATPDELALFEAGRALQGLLDLGFPRVKTHLLLNRMPKKLTGGTNRVEKALGHPIYESFADQSEELSEAYRDGRILDDKLKLGKQAVRLVSKWLGDESKPQPNRSSFSLLLSRIIS